MLKCILSALCVAVLLPVCGAGLPGQGEALELEVANQFKYRMSLNEKTPHYSAYDLNYPSPDAAGTFGDIRAVYYLPADIAGGGREMKPRPAVIVLHILGGNGALSNLFCASLASNGIPAIMFYMPIFSGRCPGGSRRAMLERPDGGELLVKALELSLLEISRTVELLRSRPEVNPEKISLLGTSLGGIIGAVALAREPRFDRAALLLAGGNLDKIIGHSDETAEMRKAIDNMPAATKENLASGFAALDPLHGAAALVPLAREGRLLMYNAENDEVVPPECTAEFAEKAGMSGKVRILPGVGHYTAIVVLPQLLDELAAFFRDETVPETAFPPESDDQAVIREVFRRLSWLVRFNPSPGHCFYIDAAFSYEEDGQTVARGNVTAARGDGNQYKITLSGDKLPVKFDKLQVGCDAAPWIISTDGSLFRGTLDPEGKSPADFFDSRARTYRDMAAGIFDMAAMGMLAPLKKFCSLTLSRGDDGNRQVEVNIQNRDFILILLKPGTADPARLTYKSHRDSGEIVFNTWALDTPADPRLFSPGAPKNGKIVEVSEKDLNRVLAAVVNFLVEGVYEK
jgi:dienelactone hydrolase